MFIINILMIVFCFSLLWENEKEIKEINKKIKIQKNL